LLSNYLAFGQPLSPFDRPLVQKELHRLRAGQQDYGCSIPEPVFTTGQASGGSADERIANVSFDEDSLSVRLKDGRTISVPLTWYPRLFHATTEQRLNWKIAGGGYGIHWPEIDEDLSTEGLLRGAPAPQQKRTA
jgi:Protein of unknown function (DUF2442)